MRASDSRGYVPEGIFFCRKIPIADNIIPAGASAQVVRPMRGINKQAMRFIPFLSAKTPFLVCIIFVTTVTTVTTYTIPR